METTGKGHYDPIGLERMGLAVTDVEWTSAAVARLEDIEARRLGINVQFARVSLARRLKTTPDTLRNYRRGRRKSVDHSFFNSVIALLVEALQAEVRELEHEVQLYRQIGEDASRDLLHEAEGQVCAARRLLGEVLGGQR